MTPPERLGSDLADARRRGEPFAEAWTVAVKRAIGGQRTDDRQAWASAFTATRDAWASAWERRPASVPERALLAVAQDPERVAMPEHGECACGTALPPPRHGPPRKWCSDGCRRAASRVALAA